MPKAIGRGGDGPVDVGGWTKAPPGWGDYIIMDNIELKESEDKLKTSLILQFQLESGDEDDGAQVSWFLTVKGEAKHVKRSEQNVADLLSSIIGKDGKTTMEASLNRKYPNEESWVSPVMCEALKTSLGGKKVALEIKHNPDRKDKTIIYANVQCVGKVGYRPVAGAKTKTAGKTDAGKATSPPEEDF